MGTRTISISDEAYSRLAALKERKESFTDVINRLTGRRSILELTGILSETEANQLHANIKSLRKKSKERMVSVARRI